MHVLVFGATGRVGRRVVELGLAASHEITAFARTPAKLDPHRHHERMRVVQGDVLDAGAVRAAMNGRFDAIVGALGADANRPTTLVQDATRIIVEAAHATGQERYLGVGAAGLLPGNWLGRMFIRLLRVTPLGHALRDHTAALEVLRRSHLTWTLAAPPLIRDVARRGRYRVAEELHGGFGSIGALDLADFLVRELEERRHPNKVVGVWY
jgi:putative NADH-flavin reductase